MLGRRSFLTALAAGSSLGLAAPSKLRIGTMDGVFRMARNPEAVAMAKKLGLTSVQVTLGRSTDGRTLPLEDRTLQKAWRDASRQHGVPLTSTYIDMLHADCLKSDANAPMWVRKGIGVTKDLGAKILMLVFFGKCQVLESAELERAIALSKELAPEAEKAGVILGFENTSSGKDNLYAVDKVASKAFRTWYDIGNSTYNGYDVPAEIRSLGRERICAFHIKDKGYLGEGKVDVAAALKAIDDIGFSGDAMLETTAPSGDVEADARRNLEYLQKLMKA
jgi:sugar phosphate isomerase/epimerase